ncbi:MAG: DUF2971 domain-containing protein [Thermodesulfobacteriota bacterium]|jgi:hypothetical protein
MELYKYCDKNGVNILRHKVLKLSRIDEFNDPHEFRIAKSENEEINRAVDALYNFQKESYRVICFSSRYNNLILWSHYSKNHTGILIKFDTGLIVVNGNKRLSSYLEEVEYKDDMIIIPDNFLELDEKTQENIIRKNTYRKYTDWRYEDEYRAIVKFDHIENKRYMDLPPESILEVIIGLHCDLETELRVPLKIS